MIKALRFCVAVCLYAFSPIGSALGAEEGSYWGADYERFMRGVLVYQPTPGSDVGKIEIPISSLDSPLEGTFDLSDFGDIKNHFSIRTGYKEYIIPDNRDKVEMWICPKFLGATAPQFRSIMSQWESPIGYFWTFGSHDVGDNFDYLVNTEVCMNNKTNCYEFEYDSRLHLPLIPNCTFCFKF
jgi:hypothetical protein